MGHGKDSWRYNVAADVQGNGKDLRIQKCYLKQKTKTNATLN